MSRRVTQLGWARGYWMLLGEVGTNLIYVGRGTIEFLCRWLAYFEALRSEVQRLRYRILIPTPKEECDQQTDNEENDA
jgi:hypothetical protein